MGQLDVHGRSRVLPDLPTRPRLRVAAVRDARLPSRDRRSALDRTLGWAAIAGLLLGVAGLIQVQLLLPIPLALVGYVAVLGWRHRDRALRALCALLATGLVAAVLVGPWLAYIAGAIARNGGVSIESSEELLPARIGFWNYPIQFGLVLPLAILGAGVVLLFLRRPDGPRPGGETGRWAPDPPEGATLLLPWWIVPCILAILYQPTWPLEDALRPQRMWLVASQPGLILAAIGLVAGAEELARRRPFSQRILAPVVVGAILVASLPTTIATERLLWNLWVEPRYAHLRLVPDRVPDMATLLPGGGAATHDPHVRGLVVARLVRHRSGGGGRRTTRLREARVRPGSVHGRRTARAAGGPRGGAPGRPKGRSSPLPTPTTPIASCSHGGTTGSG